MKKYIFKHKEIKGKVPVLLKAIKWELGEMIKYADCPLDEVET